MDEKKEKTFAESMGLSYPAEVVNRFHRQVDYEAIQAAHPDAEMVSWRSQLAYAWSHVAYHLQTTALPPPLRVDYRKDPPRSQFTDATGTYTNYIVGLFNSVSTVFTDEQNIPDAIYPYDYELRVFNENFLLDVKGVWKNHIPREIFFMHIQHLLMHECLHYGLLVESFANMVTTTRYTPERLDVADKFYNAILGYGTLEDEKQNELKTIMAMKQYYFDRFSLSGIAGDDDDKEPVSLGIVMNGPFDRFMRMKNPFYRQWSSYIMWLILRWCETFEEDKFPACNLPPRDEWKATQHDIIAYHTKLWKKEKFKFVMVD